LDLRIRKRDPAVRDNAYLRRFGMALISLVFFRSFSLIEDWWEKAADSVATALGVTGMDSAGDFHA